LAFALQLRKKHEKNLSQGSRRKSVGKEYTEQSILVNKKANFLIYILYMKNTAPMVLKDFQFILSVSQV